MLKSKAYGTFEAAVAEYGNTKGIRYLGSVDAGNYSGISPDGERVEYSLAGETKLVETTEPIA